MQSALETAMDFISSPSGNNLYREAMSEYLGLITAAKQRNDLAEQVRILREALELAVTVLCETRKHTGHRPCKYCYDMLLAYPLSATKGDSHE